MNFKFLGDIITINFFIKLFITGVIFLITWKISNQISRLIEKSMYRSKLEPDLVSFVSSISKIIFKTLVLLITVSSLGINVSSITAMLGAMLVTIGLSLKDSLSNVASGAIIITNRIFKCGDFLELNNFSGTVSKIEIMFTTLTDNEGNKIIFPNSQLTSMPIKNKGNLKNII